MSLCVKEQHANNKGFPYSGTGNRLFAVVNPIGRREYKKFLIGGEVDVKHVAGWLQFWQKMPQK